MSSAHTLAEPVRRDLVDAVKRNQGAFQEIPDTVTAVSTSHLQGHITAPPSKSYSHRALMVAGLCHQETVIENPLLSEDIFATMRAWHELGAKISYDETHNNVLISGAKAPFRGHPVPKKIFVKQSGTTLRFLLPGLALAPQSKVVRVAGNHSLTKRPNNAIVESLRQLKIEVTGEGTGHTVPITVKGNGYLPVGDVTISGDLSSQVVSAFLLWLPLASPAPPSKLSGVLKRFVGSRAAQTSSVRIQGHLVSKPYVDITLDVLEWAGIRIDVVEPGHLYRIPANQMFNASGPSFRVNGDYSSAAFILVAGCLIDSEVTVWGLKADKQGDRAIVDILKKMGANIETRSNSVTVVGRTKLRGLELDCGDIPDLVPILCVLGAFAEGQMVLKNISHLRYKETDRLKGPTEELRSLGANIECSDNSIFIRKSNLKAGRVNARGDHRLAMSLIIAGLAGEGSTVVGAPSIKKSYPWFVRDMRSLGALIEE